MNCRLILQGPSLDNDKATAVAVATNGRLIQRNGHYRLELPVPIGDSELASLRAQNDFDINRLPEQFDPQQVALIIMDMDSTLISIECIDEIADFLDIKPRVAEITAAAMRGEIDFETSLRRRLALLENLDDGVLAHVYNERLSLNPGAEIMIRRTRQRGIKIALVSGGFTYFTEKLKSRLGLDYTLANELKFSNGKLIGLENDVIVGAQSKADFLCTVCRELDITPDRAIAIGDGANDLLMMQLAGLSVAYHAKPAVQQQAVTTLNHCGLDGVLGFLDIDNE